MATLNGIPMKAILWTGYGPPDVLQLAELEKPTPGPDEILVRNRATTVTAGDCELRGFKVASLSVLWFPLRLYFGPRRPTRIRILGQELAGDVAAVGRDVTRFREGDPVFAATGFRLSAHAEYTCLPEKGMVALKPTNLSYEEAAAVPLGGIEAWQYLRRASIQAGDRVLINGAGGSIGTLAVQLARHFGGVVTAVDRSEKLAMLRSIGADQVIDYTQEDFTERRKTYDVIFDVVGSSPLSRCERALKPGGRYFSANPGPSALIRGLWPLRTGRRQAVGEYNRRRSDDLLFLKGLIEAGAIKPVVDRLYPLERMAEAHRYVESGRKQGNVVISVALDQPI